MNRYIITIDQGCIWTVAMIVNGEDRCVSGFNITGVLLQMIFVPKDFVKSFCCHALILERRLISQKKKKEKKIYLFGRRLACESLSC